MDWRKVLLETLGWYGLVATLSAYGLISSGIVGGNSIFYHLLNLTGALALATIVWQKRAWPLVVLNLVWTAIAIFALARIILG
uniref:CBU-0592-like domain-containing protein n=1 Tax=candidate division WWE3 bacterium TaxID=2053526 RepID=A0A831Z1L4_UNCKA